MQIRGISLKLHVALAPRAWLCDPAQLPQNNWQKFQDSWLLLLFHLHRRVREQHEGVESNQSLGASFLLWSNIAVSLIPGIFSTDVDTSRSSCFTWTSLIPQNCEPSSISLLGSIGTPLLWKNKLLMSWMATSRMLPRHPRHLVPGWLQIPCICRLRWKSSPNRSFRGRQQKRCHPSVHPVGTLSTKSVGEAKVKPKKHRESSHGKLIRIRRLLFPYPEMTEPASFYIELVWTHITLITMWISNILGTFQQKT